MAAIKYTQFIGIRTAENGSNGFITNSTSYSLLIVYTDGTREIVEGNAQAMRPFLAFLKEDNMERVLRESLEQLEQKLEKLVDSRIERIFAVSNPIPDVMGMRQDQAVALLEQAGFRVKMVNDYPEGTPSGIVRAYQREDGHYMTVLLDARLDLPEVAGLPEDKAVALLEEAGFRVTLLNHYPEGMPMGHVYACSRSSAASIDVTLDVRHDLPDVKGKPIAEATAILEAAGFTVDTVYQDQLKMDYMVSEVVRSDPRKLEVVLRASSRMMELKGLKAEEARRLVERLGIKANMVRKISQEYPAGCVCDWEGDKNGIVLYVSSGDRDWAARSVQADGRIAGEPDVECVNPTVTYHPKTHEITITCEIRQTTKNKYLFSDYCKISFDRKQFFSEPVVNMYNEQVEGDRWYTLEITSLYADFMNNKPERILCALSSSYGVFKKEAIWNLKFDVTW